MRLGNKFKCLLLCTDIRGHIKYINIMYRLFGHVFFYPQIKLAITTRTMIAISCGLREQKWFIFSTFAYTVMCSITDDHWRFKNHDSCGQKKEGEQL